MRLSFRPPAARRTVHYYAELGQCSVFTATAAPEQFISQVTVLKYFSHYMEENLMDVGAGLRAEAGGGPAGGRVPGAGEGGTPGHRACLLPPARRLHTAAPGSSALSRRGATCPAPPTPGGLGSTSSSGSSPTRP